ncbi:MAG: thiamine ABC transporter substrate-binding protein [Bdellovibrionaceae bacterium]|nr:thiamine ABC transporter substrate-binding protein [Pseudobdellovibrionaceae bacterium]
MKHFLLYITSVFLILFIIVINKNQKVQVRHQKAVVRIFSYSSFTGKGGPGPRLKEEFEKTCACVVEFIDGNDSGVLLQKLKLEGESLGADLVIGFDQYDLQKALAEIKWRQLDFSNLDVDPEIKPVLSNSYFVPYDWGVLSFVGRKSELNEAPESLDDLLKSEFTKKIALEDPRYSSPGMQFLFWVIRSKGEEDGFKYLRKMMEQAHSFAPSWSTAYGLFQKKQALLVFSYLTSPLYHLIEEKNSDYVALEFKEPHPVQFEFVGIPDFCKQCGLSEKFINLMLSIEGQRMIMSRNYMFPVVKAAKEGTLFAHLVPKNLMKFDIPSINEIDRFIKHWSDLRRSESL